MPKDPSEETARCVEHDCPMLLIDDDYVCSLEYVDEHLGGKQVKDLVVIDEGLITVLFEDDHELPLLCPHCGDPLDLDEDELLSQIGGLYLVALQYEPADPEADEYEGIDFLFASDPDVDVENIPDDVRTEALLLHLDSAFELVCPAQT